MTSPIYQGGHSPIFHIPLAIKPNAMMNTDRQSQHIWSLTQEIDKVRKHRAEFDVDNWDERSKMKSLFEASCPDIVQTMILDKIRSTIRAKIEREHGIRQDHREGFTDDWAAVAAELGSQSSTNLSRWTVLLSPTPINLRLAALVNKQNHSQTTDRSFD